MFKASDSCINDSHAFFYLTSLTVTENDLACQAFKLAMVKNFETFLPFLLWEIMDF